LDTRGNLYIADYWNHVVRKVDFGGTISTVAGNGAFDCGMSNYAGTPATQTAYGYPSAMWAQV
jgi:hypothetical protein